MHLYFEKARTTVGWKGLINDPYLDQSFKISDGLRLARHLLLDLAEMGVPAGTEFPDMMAHRIASGSKDCRLSILGKAEKAVRMRRRLNGLNGDLHVARRAILESRRARQTRNQLPDALGSRSFAPRSLPS